MATGDPAKVCNVYRKMAACYPKCACDDATYKTTNIKPTLDGYSSSMNCGTIGCGAAAAAGAATSIRATVFTGIVAALVAIFAAQ